MLWLRQILACPALGRLRLREEEQICVGFANTLRVATFAGKLTCLWLHLPNESKRSRAAGAILRAMGLVPGAPDYLFARGDATYFLEFKTAKGKQNSNQTAFQRWCETVNVPYVLVRSEAEALKQLQDWGLLEP